DAFEKYILDQNTAKPEQPVTTKIEPLMTKMTQDSQLKFEGTTMTTGLYLVVGEKTISGYDIYTPASFLMALPNAGVDENGDNVLDYDVIVEVKYEHVNTYIPTPTPDPTPEPTP